VVRDEGTDQRVLFLADRASPADPARDCILMISRIGDGVNNDLRALGHRFRDLLDGGPRPSSLRIWGEPRHPVHRVTMWTGMRMVAHGRDGPRHGLAGVTKGRSGELETRLIFELLGRRGSGRHGPPG